MSGELPGWYVPPDGYLWDPWFHRVGSTFHVFYLFQPVPESFRRDETFARSRPTIAHAVWSSGEGWIYRGTAIDYAGQPYDAERIHTGCVVERNGDFFMLYSGSNKFICLARSEDLNTWTKVPENPVASPDPAIYMAHWRDPWVLEESPADEYTMVVAGQQNNGEGTVAKVAVAHSPDLRHWEQDLPLEVPDWFEWMEVPELHCIDDIWYLLFVTRQKWVTEQGKDALRAQGLDALDGAYYMMASSWRGPFETIRFLSEQVPGAYTTRLLRRSPTEYWLWSHVEKDHNGRPLFGLRPPVLCVPARGGGLSVTTAPSPSEGVP